jgi:hypothetical protein
MAGASSTKQIGEIAMRRVIVVAAALLGSFGLIGCGGGGSGSDGGGIENPTDAPRHDIGVGSLVEVIPFGAEVSGEPIEVEYRVYSAGLIVAIAGDKGTPIDLGQLVVRQHPIDKTSASRNPTPRVASGATIVRNANDVTDAVLNGSIVLLRHNEIAKIRLRISDFGFVPNRTYVIDFANTVTQIH